MQEKDVHKVVYALLCKNVFVKLNGHDEMHSSLVTSLYRTEICCALGHILIFLNKAFH